MAQPHRIRRFTLLSVCAMSLVAFRVNQQANKRIVTSGWGNAANWAASAQSAGYTHDGSPHVGDVAWDPNAAGGLGHVAYVSGVTGIGSSATVSLEEYNWIVG